MYRLSMLIIFKQKGKQKNAVIPGMIDFGNWWSLNGEGVLCHSSWNIDDISRRLT